MYTHEFYKHIYVYTKLAINIYRQVSISAIYTHTKKRVIHPYMQTMTPSVIRGQLDDTQFSYREHSNSKTVSP